MPRAMLVLPSGLTLGARSTGALPCWSPPDAALYLGSRREQQRSWRSTTHTWTHRWVDWPSGRRPRETAAAAAAVVELVERARAGQRVEVACRTGTARTGTVVACAAVMEGMTTSDAVEWARRHYTPGAVALPWLRSWVEDFAARHGARAR